MNTSQTVGLVVGALCVCSKDGNLGKPSRPANVFSKIIWGTFAACMLLPFNCLFGAQVVGSPFPLSPDNSSAPKNLVDISPNESTSASVYTYNKQMGRFDPSRTDSGTAVPSFKGLAQNAGFEPHAATPGKEEGFLYKGRGITISLEAKQILFGIGQNRVQMVMENASQKAKLESDGGVAYKVNYLVGSASDWKRGVPAYSGLKYSNLYRGIDVKFRKNSENVEFDYLIAPSANPRDIRLAFRGATLSLDRNGDLLVGTSSQPLRLKRPNAYQLIDGAPVGVESHFILSKRGSVGFGLGSYDRRLPLIIDPVIVYGTYIGGSGAEDAHKIVLDQGGNAYIVGTAILPTDMAATSGAFQQTPINNTVIFVAKLNAAGTQFDYLSYLGGTDPSKGSDGFDIAVDQTGAAYICGVTLDSTYPTTPGAFQAVFAQQTPVITKLTPGGDGLVFSTFLSSPTSSLREGSGATAIAVDSSGAVYVTGFVTAPDFPVTPNAPQQTFGGIEDAFVAKLNPDGSKLVYSTYIGGSGQEGPTFTIAVDQSGNAYVAGHTPSPDFPTTPGAFKTGQNTFDGRLGNAFITKINPEGTSFVYSTLLGSDAQFNDVEPSGIAIDSQGNAVVAGFTSDASFPVTAGAYQTSASGVFQNSSLSAFITKLSSDGSKLAFSTFLGGAGDNAATALVLDTNQNIVVTGETDSPFFPTTPDGSGPLSDGGIHGFLSVLTSDGAGLTFSTTIFGSGADQPSGLALGPANTIFVSGHTSSIDFPVTSMAAQQKYGGGSRDGFIIAVRPPGSSLSSGTILVTTNNVGATFSITGPATYAGSGQSFTQTNAPTGTYTITYGSIPGYVTPQPGIAVLSGGRTVTFSGIYQAITITATPPSVSVTHPVNLVEPPSPIQVLLTSTGTSVLFTATASVNNDRKWLSVSTNTNSTPAILTLTITRPPAVGTYLGQITINVPSATNSLLQIPVTLIISPAAPPPVISDINEFRIATGANEPSIALDRHDPMHAVVGFNDTNGCGWSETRDGGKSWIRGNLLFLDSFTGLSDPWVRYSASGQLFYSCIARHIDIVNGTATVGVFVATSTTGRASDFQTAVPVITAQQDCFSGSGSACEGSSEFTDHPAIGFVENNGRERLVVCWVDFFSPSENHFLFSSFSPDGKLWSEPQALGGPHATNCTIGGSSSEIAVTWIESRQSGDAVQIRTSTDGLNWTATRTLGLAGSLIFPSQDSSTTARVLSEPYAITVSINSGLRTVWDARPQTRSQLFYADEANNWTPVPISSPTADDFLQSAGTCSNIIGAYEGTNTSPSSFRYKLWKQSNATSFIEIFRSTAELDGQNGEFDERFILKRVGDYTGMACNDNKVWAVWTQPVSSSTSEIWGVRLTASPAR